MLGLNVLLTLSYIMHLCLSYLLYRSINRTEASYGGTAN